MPEHLKSATNTKEFNSYLTRFVRDKERQHFKKVAKKAITSLLIMIAG